MDHVLIADILVLVDLLEIFQRMSDVLILDHIDSLIDVELYQDYIYFEIILDAQYKLPLVSQLAQIHLFSQLA